MPLDGADIGDSEEVNRLTADPEQRLRDLYFAHLTDTENRDELDLSLVDQIFDQARRVIAHPEKPRTRLLKTFEEYPDGELALDETLEEDPLFDSPSSIFVESYREKELFCHSMLDCSSSMSGEKHLLASIAVAVMLLEIPPMGISLTTFASQSKTIKSFGSDEMPRQVVLNFLKSRPKGFTNIEEGLWGGIRQHRQFGGKRRLVGLIATDGRSTEGRDPREAAKLYDYLLVLHLKGPGSHLEDSQAMAYAGNGDCLEVSAMSELPRRVYDALRVIARYA